MDFRAGFSNEENRLGSVTDDVDDLIQSLEAVPRDLMAMRTVLSGDTPITELERVLHKLLHANPSAFMAQHRASEKQHADIVLKMAEAKGKERAAGTGDIGIDAGTARVFHNVEEFLKEWNGTRGSELAPDALSGPAAPASTKTAA